MKCYIFILLVCYNALAAPIPWNIPSELTVQVGEEFGLDIPFDAFLPDGGSPFKVSLNGSNFMYSLDFTPEVIGSLFDEDGWTMDLQWYEDFLYVLVNNRLEIFDVSDPYRPQKVGSYTHDEVFDFQSLQVVGDYVYITVAGEGLLRVDASDKTNPKKLDVLPIDGFEAHSFPSLYVFPDVNYTYVANDENLANSGVVIVDHGNVPMMVEFFIPSLPSIRIIRVYGDLAFFACTSDEGEICDDDIHIYNVSDPLYAQQIHVMTENYGLMDIAYDEDRKLLFLSLLFDGLKVYNLESLDSPTLIYDEDFPLFSPAGLSYDKDAKMLLASGDGGLGVYNVSDPSAVVGLETILVDSWLGYSDSVLRYVDSHPYSGNGMDIVYLGGGLRGVYFLEVDREKMVTDNDAIHHVAWSANTVDVIEVYGDLLFFSSLDQKFVKILDISVPSTAPRVMGTFLMFLNPCTAISYREEDQTMFLSNEVGFLVSVNLSNIYRPRHLHTFNDESVCNLHSIHKEFAYCNRLEGDTPMMIVNISDPSAPELEEAEYGVEIETPYSSFIDSSRGFLYVTFDDFNLEVSYSLLLLDVSNNTYFPDNPNRLEEYACGEKTFYKVSCAVNTQMCYVSDTTQSGGEVEGGVIRFIDVSDSSEFGSIGEFDLNGTEIGAPYGSLYANDHIVAFGACKTEESVNGGVFSALDVSDLANPIVLAMYHQTDFEDDCTYGVSGRGNLVYYDSGNGINIFLAGQGLDRVYGTAPETCGDHHFELIATDINGETVHPIVLKIRSQSYIDDECTVTMCNGILSNDTENVCSGYGTCIAPPSTMTYGNGTCSCNPSFLGKDCEVFSCFGVLSNDTTNVCSGPLMGECVVLNGTTGDTECVCKNTSSKYGLFPTGDSCQYWNCSGVPHELDSETCSNHGKCTGQETCTCDEDYFGDICNITTCSGYWNNDSFVISSNGIPSNTSICHGKGECVYHNNCSCDYNSYMHLETGSIDCSCNSLYFGDYCNETYCDGFWYSDPGVCHGHGICDVENRTCTCLNDSYSGDFCESWNCFEYENSERGVCSRHGTCLDVHICKCDSIQYTGAECQYWSCWGINVMTLETVCSGHGFCIDQDFCSCFEGYSSDEAGWNCSNWFCGRYEMDHPSVCSERGECVEYQTCECHDNYEGETCETWSCGFDKDDEENTCSGHGECISPDNCDCGGGFAGSRCQTDVVLYATLAPVVTLAGMLLLIIFLCVVCCCCILACFCTVVICGLIGIGCIQKAKVSQYSKLKNFDVLLKEQKADADQSIAHLRIDKSLFEVKFDEISIEEMLGEGGSSSIVYRAKWNAIIVAFKCFKTRMICQSQETFDTFEREIEVMASISHPNVVTFFGATLQQPRVGIVMEFCENGDLFQFLGDVNYFGVFGEEKSKKMKRKKMKKKGGEEEETETASGGNKRVYPLKEKLRMLHEVVQSMDYLHSRGIVHRDLKLENVLVDKFESCKLMDFGLSTIVDRLSQVKTTRIGTQLYMAPEVLSDSAYSEKCDVFSFSIFIYVFLTEIWEPYGDQKEAIHIEIKVSSDPKFRPPLHPFDQLILQANDSLKWLKDLMVRCWEHEGEDRPSFSEMNDLFKGKSREIEEKGIILEYFHDKTDNIINEEEKLKKKYDGASEETIELLKKELEEIKSVYLEMKGKMVEGRKGKELI